MFLQAIRGPLAELLQVPACFRDADNRDIQMTALYHGLERREYLLVGQIAGCAEKYQGIGGYLVH